METIPVQWLSLAILIVNALQLALMWNKRN
jgi:hypothetical protein